MIPRVHAYYPEGLGEFPPLPAGFEYRCPECRSFDVIWTDAIAAVCGDCGTEWEVRG